MNFNKLLNLIFTPKVLNDLFIKGTNNNTFENIVKYYINNHGNKTYSQIFSEIYDYLGCNYRNEYYYMNTLFNKLFKANITTALSQVHIGQSIVDLVLLNDDIEVFEIKSDRDQFGRLNSQLSDYFKGFSKVSVLVPLYKYESIQRILSSFGKIGNVVGIYLLSEKDIMCIKKPKLFTDYLNYTTMFKILRKKEYENIIVTYFGKIPKVKPVFQFEVCLECFTQIPLLDAQKAFINGLKKRNYILKTTFDTIPFELRSVVYFSKLHKKWPKMLGKFQSVFVENF